MTFDPTRPTTSEPSTPAAPEPFTPATPEPSAVPTSPVTPASPAVASPAPGAKRGSGGGWLNAVLVLAAAVAIGGVAFAIGRGTAPVSAATGTGPIFNGGTGFPTGSFAPGANGGPGLGRGGFIGVGGGLTISGTVESVDGDMLTIKTESGQTVELKTDTDTTYHAQVPAAASDVTAGTSVQVQVDGAAGGFRPGASAEPSEPVGTAGSVTVIP